MTAPTFYSSNDAGATWPAPEAAGQPNDHARFYGFYHILKSCLVEGYPGQPAAGWTMLFDEIALGTGTRYALTNATKTGVMVCSLEVNGHTEIMVCDGLPELDNPINGWSYQNPHPSTLSLSHYFRAYNDAHYYSGAGQWHLVANENACCFMVVSNNHYLALKPDSYDEDMPMVWLGACNGPDNMGTIGAPELGNFIVVGGKGVSPTSPTSSGGHRFLGNAKTTCFTSTRDAAGAIREAAATDIKGHPSQNISTSAAANRACLVPVCFGEADALTYVSPMFINAFCYTQAAAINIAAAVSKSLYEPIDIGGKSYIAFNRPTNHPAIFVSMEASDWL